MESQPIGRATRRATRKLLRRICDLTCELQKRTATLEKPLAHESTSAEAHARHFRDKVIPAMDALREVGDRIELLVPSDLWPLPTYRELMFIK